MCSESLMSRPARSATILSGIASAGQTSAMRWRTTFSTPPRRMPGAVDSLMNWTGTSTVIVEPGDDAEEVDMDRLVAHRVELEVAGDRPDLLAGDVDRGDRGEEAAAMELEEQLAVGKVDRQRGLLAAIDHGGNQALTTDCSGGPLAHLFADRRRELVSLAHRTTP